MKKQENFKRKLLVVATVAAVELMTSTASFSATSVTGILVDGTGSALVVGGGQLYENAATIGNTSASAAGATVWVEGVGNTINNSGTISRQSSTGSTYGVFLGDYSTARGDVANKAVAGADATSGAFGSTTMRITIPTTAGTNGLNATTLVGKQLVMAGVVIDGEARAGDTRNIVSATAVANATNTFDIVVDKAWARIDANGDPVSQVGNSYNLIAGSGLNILNNSGTISATYTGTSVSSTNIRAIDTSVAGDYIINNAATGHIIGTHTSVGTAQGIDAGGDVTTMTINNEGEIKAVRTTPTITITSNKFYELKGTGGGITNQSIGSASAIYSQEELESITINNASNGLIVGEGDLNPAIYLRAGAQSIVNDGTISGSKNGANYGMAIGSVSDGGEVRTLNLQNTGTINGAILGVNANAYRYYALSNFDGATANATGTNTNFATNRLLTNGSNWGQLDATIVNNEDATINGKVYLSNGAHTIVNHGIMVGGLDLDQRDTKTERVNNYDAGFVPGKLGENTVQTAIVKLVKLSNADNQNSATNNQTAYVYNLAASPGEYTTDTTGLTADNTYQYTAAAFASSSTAYSGLFTVVGTKSFTLENAGTFTGDILVHTASSGALGHTVTSEVTLSPYVTGAGGTTADTATNNIHKFDGNLIVVSTSAAGGEIDDITIAPKVMSGTVVRSGQFYNVANGVKYGNTYAGVALLTQASADLPSGFSNGLVTWTPSINASGALVVGSEVEVAGVAGLHAKSKSALTALMSVDSELGSQIQNLETSEQVRKASEQLRPEINGATTQASMNVTGKLQDLVGSRLDQIHLASVAGRSGIATGDETRTADGTGVWMQAFGAKGSQDRRENTDGYNTQAYGFAVGADQLVDDETRVGFVGSYGQSTVNGLGDGTGNRTSIDSYQAALYGSTLLRKLYLNGTLGLGYHDYTNNRFVLANSIKGSHDAWQGSAKLDVGYPIKMNAVTLVPVASLAYSHLAESGYTESGVGALAISGRDTDSFRTGLGAKAMIPLLENAVSAGLELRAIWNHEFGDASIDTTARFVDGGASFTTNGVALERDSANLGASLRLSGVMDGIKQSLNVNYDAEVKNQYLNQTASLQARFDF